MHQKCKLKTNGSHVCNLFIPYRGIMAVLSFSTLKSPYCLFFTELRVLPQTCKLL